MSRLIRVVLFQSAQSLISLESMDGPGSVLGNARLACCVCFIPVIAAARRLFRDCAAGVCGDESRPNARGVKRRPWLIARLHCVCLRPLASWWPTLALPICRDGSRQCDASLGVAHLSPQ